VITTGISSDRRVLRLAFLRLSNESHLSVRAGSRSFDPEARQNELRRTHCHTEKSLAQKGWVEVAFPTHGRENVI
jgi:hypothetical protein